MEKKEVIEETKRFGCCLDNECILLSYCPRRKKLNIEELYFCQIEKDGNCIGDLNR